MSDEMSDGMIKALWGPLWEELFGRAPKVIEKAPCDLRMVHDKCRGPWLRGQSDYPIEEHIRDCERCLRYNEIQNHNSINRAGSDAGPEDMVDEGKPKTITKR